MQANTKEVKYFNDRNRDAKICCTLKLMKIIGLKKGPIDYDLVLVLKNERMMKCLHNSIDFFNNETMKSLILGYFKGKGKMENVLPSMSWDKMDFFY